jgi:hypothetical protein
LIERLTKTSNNINIFKQNYSIIDKVKKISQQLAGTLNLGVTGDYSPRNTSPNRIPLIATVADDNLLDEENLKPHMQRLEK